MQIYSIERIVQEKRQKKYLSFQKNMQKVSFCKPHFALSNKKRCVIYVLIVEIIHFDESFLIPLVA